MEEIVDSRKPLFKHSTCPYCQVQMEYATTTCDYKVKCYSCKKLANFNTSKAKSIPKEESNQKSTPKVGTGNQQLMKMPNQLILHITNCLA
jgi:hypothetical protein